jgi:hypothetical protein
MLDKALYSNVPQLNTVEPDIEIEVENPDSMKVGIGGIEIDLDPKNEHDGSEDFYANLAEEMDEGELQSLASKLIEEVDADVHSRRDWAETYVKGLEVLGMKYEERTEPWNGACGVFSTVLTEAAIRFQAETITETFPAAGPVKTEIMGAIDRLKMEASQRVQNHMNYYLVEKMPEYRPEHERLLLNLGLIGSAFKKVYPDQNLGRPVSMYVGAEDLIMPYGSSGVMHCERATHMMRKTKNEVHKLQVSGFYRDIDLGEPVHIPTDIEKKKADEAGYSITDDDRYHLAEIHVDYVMPGDEDEDEIAKPYVITIERGSRKVLSIRRNWEEGDKKHLKRQHFVQYTYIPGFGAYGFGLINLIGGYARAGTMIIRQLVDAGSLANLPGGLKARGLRVKGDDTPIAPGEFRDVDVPGGSIKDNIMTLPYKEPSQTLATLLASITDEARKLGSIADMNISDMSANAPVGTTLALLERQLKTMSAVQARVHYSMKQEFKLLKPMIRDFAPKDYEYDPEKADKSAKQSDYDLVEVIPVSDPNSSTMAQRLMQYQAAMQMAQQAPQIYNLPKLHRQMLDVIGIPNAEDIVPTEDDQKPRDPISENMAFLKGKPTKAFMYQDHDAHISIHQAMMQDPLLQAQIGQSPMGQQMGSAIMAHISEHLAFQYRNKIQQQLGATLPAPDEDMPQDLEVQISQLTAQAAQQVLQQSKGQAAQQQAQQQAQDPLVQMQQQELKIAQMDAQTRAQKVQGDLQIKQAELQIKSQQAQQKAGPNPQIEEQAKIAETQQNLQTAAQAHQQNLAHNEQQHQADLRMLQQKHEQSLSEQQQMARIRVSQEMQRMQIAENSAKQMDEIRKRQAEQQAKSQNVKSQEPRKDK